MTVSLDNVPLDDDTTLLFEQRASFGELETVYQKWKWDGIVAESLVFRSEDVLTSGIEALLDDINSSTLVNDGSEITSKNSNGYFFVNFNFSVL